MNLFAAIRIAADNQQRANDQNYCQRTLKTLRVRAPSLRYAASKRSREPIFVSAYEGA
jgi:hypothetical protein